MVEVICAVDCVLIGCAGFLQSGLRGDFTSWPRDQPNTPCFGLSEKPVAPGCKAKIESISLDFKTDGGNASIVTLMSLRPGVRHCGLSLRPDFQYMTYSNVTHFATILMNNSVSYIQNLDG